MKTNRRASTLLLTVWAVLVVSAVVLAFAGWVGEGIEADGAANRELEARAQAHSGAAVALHPGVSRMNPALRREFGLGKYYSVTIESEGGRVNLNYLLAGAEPQKTAFLKRVLAARGIGLRERERLVDSLLDWVNPATGMRRPNARAEGADYRPPHRPLRSLDEVALVDGCGPLVGEPGWKDDFTLASAGPLDIEGVSAKLLAIVPGIGEERARAFVKRRQERASSRNDPYENFEEAARDLGLQSDQMNDLSMLLGFRDSVRRITSVGVCGAVRWRVEAVAKKGGSLILWNEKKD